MTLNHPNLNFLRSAVQQQYGFKVRNVFFGPPGTYVVTYGLHTFSFIVNLIANNGVLLVFTPSCVDKLHMQHIAFSGTMATVGSQRKCQVSGSGHSGVSAALAGRG